MAKLFTNATLVLADRLLPDGWLLEENGKIARYGSGEAPAVEEIIDCGGNYLSPGFIDVHCHGGGGGSFGKLEPEEHVKALKMHLAHGTTSITPTAGTDKVEEMKQFAAIKAEIDKRSDLPHHLGYFMETPFTQPHPDMQVGNSKPPVLTPDVYEELLCEAKGVVNRWMAAPELVGGMEFGRALRAAGITACMGHSNATLTEVEEAMKNGYSCVVHLYSVMSTVTRDNGFRRGGLVEAGLLFDDLDVEIICDGCHLPPELIKLAVKCKGYDRLMLVSDCGPLGGFPEGEYEADFGPMRVKLFIEDGVCFDDDINVSAVYLMGKAVSE